MKVSVLPATIEKAQDKFQNFKTEKLRVCAYARVSTVLEEQQNSFESQVRYYTDYINENENWELTKIYADDGASGAQASWRNNFMEMINDGLAGKFDLIITKAVTRFARNTLDSLKYTRILKEKGIDVFFEENNMHSMDDKGELMLTLYSALAQEYIHNLSRNVKWGIHRRFEQGTVWLGNLLGYTKDSEGNNVIVPEEASTVRMAAILFLEGKTFYHIKEQFIAEGRLTKRGTTNWSIGGIERMLTNEKYTGNALMGKTYCPDYLTKKRVRNNGESDQYYIEGSHPVILPQEVFDMIQEEIELRKVLSNENGLQNNKKAERNNVYSSQYALSNILVCGECGALYRRCTWTARGKIRHVWRCGERKRSGTKICKNSPTINESTLHETLIKVINNLIQTSDNVENQNSLLNHLDVEKNELKTKLRELARKSLDLQSAKNKIVEHLMESKESSNSYSDYQMQIDGMQKEIEYNMMKFDQFRLEKAKLECQIRRNQQLNELLVGIDYQIDEYDDELIRKIVNKVLVLNSEYAQIVFKTGNAINIEIAMK